MRKWIVSAGLFAVIGLSAICTGIALYRQRPSRPVIGSIYRSKVDAAGHTRGVVQVDLMRTIMASRERATGPSIGSDDRAAHGVPSQAHHLLGRPAPSMVLVDSEGKTRDLREPMADGPVVVVFYLGASCVACVSHLVELDAARSRFHERGAVVWAVSADKPEVSRDRGRRFGDLAIPLLSDPDHAVATAYGAWKPIPGGDKDEGEPLHATFIVDPDGTIRWAYLGNRPFNDVEALLAELSRLNRQEAPAP
jgi:thioredoxin-dependent peroxiredoxin